LRQSRDAPFVPLRFFIGEAEGKRNRDNRRLTEIHNQLIRLWLIEQQAQVLPRSPIAQAIGFTLNQWPALIVYTTDPRLSIGRVEVWRDGLPDCWKLRNPAPSP
jgi:hypothetical protein